MTRRLSPAALLLLAACTTTTGVETTPTYLPAARVDIPPELEPPAIPAPRQPRVIGVDAVAAAQRGVTVLPNDLTMTGTTWRIDDVDPHRIYAIPVAPLAATTIRFPAHEGLVHAAIGAGPVDDFTVNTAATGTRAAAFIMPTCASPNTQRFTLDSDTPIRPCYTGRARATFLTSEGPIHVRFDVYDYTSVADVEFNRAPPPPTNVSGTRGRPPMPLGPRDMLHITPLSGEYVAWQPLEAWADQTKMVLRFHAPLPTLPALFAGQQGEQQVNFSVREMPDSVYIVTDRRVTEAELRIDTEVVRISGVGPRQRRVETQSHDPRFDRRN